MRGCVKSLVSHCDWCIHRAALRRRVPAVIFVFLPRLLMAFVACYISVVRGYGVHSISENLKNAIPRELVDLRVAIRIVPIYRISCRHEVIRTRHSSARVTSIITSLHQWLIPADVRRASLVRSRVTASRIESKTGSECFLELMCIFLYSLAFSKTWPDFAYGNWVSSNKNALSGFPKSLELA